MKIKHAYKRQALIAYLFLTPWLIGFFTLSLWPMISSLHLSFTDYNLMTPGKWVGLQNYNQMFTNDDRYIASLKVTFTYVLLSVPLKLGFALLVAMLLNKGMRGLGLYRTIYYIPSLLGASVSIAMLWTKLFDQEGAINRILSIVGIEGKPWIANPQYALYPLIALTVWEFGSSMVIFLAGLKQIPADYYEASSIDGAGKFRQFVSITFPLLTPVIFFNLVMQFIHLFQSFTPAYIISGGQGGPINSTLFYTLYLYIKGFSNYEMGYASAMAWVLLVIISVLTIVLFKTSSRWVHYEDGKG